MDKNLVIFISLDTSRSLKKLIPAHKVFSAGSIPQIRPNKRFLCYRIDAFNIIFTNGLRLLNTPLFPFGQNRIQSLILSGKSKVCYRIASINQNNTFFALFSLVRSNLYFWYLFFKDNVNSDKNL